MANGNGIALITGASSGIGAVYADRLAARGKDLILVARRRDRLEKLAASLRQKFDRNVDIVEADLADPSDLASVETIIRNTSEIDTLVNNAGLGAAGASVSADPKAVEQLVKVNVLALTTLSLAATPRFIERDRGTIINLGSLIAFKASPFAAAYCGSKVYVLNFTRSLQAECANTNVKVQLVIPGWVNTEFFGGTKPPVPENQFMTAETLVDCAMSGLDNGELICVPILHDLQAWKNYLEACQRVTEATQIAEPASRYGVGVIGA
jgi:short-subunit dehydrogenase